MGWMSRCSTHALLAVRIQRQFSYKVDPYAQSELWLQFQASTSQAGAASMVSVSIPEAYFDTQSHSIGLQPLT